MELEYYENTNNDYPNDSIFCIKKFTKDELIKLSMEIDNLLDRYLNINLSDLSYMNNLTKKTLILKIGEENKGIIKINENIYECILEKTKYIEMKEILFHFIANEAKITTGYNWLYNIVTDIDFLLSYNGSW
jgi:hypothetical protein